MKGGAGLVPSPDEAVDLGPLADSLTFHLKRTDALVFQHFNRRVPREHLVRGEMAILTLARSNQGVRQDVLGRAVGLDKSTISTVYDRARGLAPGRLQR